MANKKETKTHFNYNRLWKLLIDRESRNRSCRRKVMLVPHLSQRWEEVRMSQLMSCSVFARHWTVMWKTLWNVCRMTNRKRPRKSPDYWTADFIY